MTEKEIQRAIMRLLILFNCDVYSTSQLRASRVSEGISDLIVFSPKAGVAFIEVKSKAGKQRPAQRAFQQACERAGGTYILAYGVEAVRDWLGAKAEEGR